jgi:hypothetical protein
LQWHIDEIAKSPKCIRSAIPAMVMLGVREREDLNSIYQCASSQFLPEAMSTLRGNIQLTNYEHMLTIVYKKVVYYGKTAKLQESVLSSREPIFQAKGNSSFYTGGNKFND